jgi:hypothetical protein
MIGRLQRAADWMFRSRVDGRITIAQLPNVALGFVIATTLLQMLLRNRFSGNVDVLTALRWAVRAATVWWAGDELLRGVNPWRRLLGAGVLVSTFL